MLLCNFKKAVSVVILRKVGKITKAGAEHSLTSPLNDKRSMVAKLVTNTAGNTFSNRFRLVFPPFDLWLWNFRHLVHS